MLCDLDAFRKDPAITFGYSYFVDDSPTKFVGSVNDIEEEPVEEEEVEEKSSIIPILTGVAVTLVLALVVLGIIFIPKFLNGSTAEIACPDFVGMKFDEILDNKEYNANFKFDDEWDHSDEYEYGYVFEQSEREGEMLKKGAKITLYISMGENTKKVPDVYGKSESAAKTELEANGFKTTVVEMLSEDVEKGLVVKTEPQRTQVVEENAKITIYVSSGKPERKVAVPDVVGMTEEAAKKKLEDEKLTVKVMETQLTSKDKFYPVGTVAKQEPDNSKKDALEGEEITIYVCSGYKFDLEVDLPMDLSQSLGTFSISLWENGAMFNKGNTVDGSELSTYTFKDLVTKSEEAVLTVKVSNGGKWYDYCEITVDNKTGKQSVNDRIANYQELIDAYNSSSGEEQTGDSSQLEE